MKQMIDLNADLGELPGETGRVSDRAILSYVTSCSIACGGHAGDEETMRTTLLAAKRMGVICGAHPSYPDREGFGRRTIVMPQDELKVALQNQMRALKQVADELSIPLGHVKPHGALYNEAGKRVDIAGVCADAICAVFGKDAAVICQPGFALADAAKERGLAIRAEGFIDRAYNMDGTLRPRTEPGAVLETEAERIAQARDLVLRFSVKIAEGQISLKPDTLCLHGDSPGAVETVRAVRIALEADGVQISAPA